MRILHLSDLHLGKRVNGFSMMEDQAYILRQIEEIIQKEDPQVILMAGDIYDKPVPPAEAVGLFDDFLYRISATGRQAIIISGNHDSPDRLAFGGRLMDHSGIHMAPIYDGKVEPILLSDEAGEVAFYPLPFLKPIHVRQVFKDEAITEYSQAMERAIEAMEMDSSRRNVLITHQFVTGSTRSESEEIIVGGTDNVDAAVFADFDYVALGHLHRPQPAGGERIRYAGSPLCYSFSEADQDKTVTLVDLKEKGKIEVREIPLRPLRPMKELRGSYMELTDRSYYEELDRQAYYRITLTDEEDVVDGAAKLRVIYPNLMRLDYDNRRTGTDGVELEKIQTKRDPMEVMSDLYLQQNGQEPDEEQKRLLRSLIREIWQEDEEVAG